MLRVFLKCTFLKKINLFNIKIKNYNLRTGVMCNLHEHVFF